MDDADDEEDDVEDVAKHSSGGGSEWLRTSWMMTMMGQEEGEAQVARKSQVDEEE